MLFRKKTHISSYSVLGLIHNLLNSINRNDNNIKLRCKNIYFSVYPQLSETYAENQERMYHMRE